MERSDFAVFLLHQNSASMRLRKSRFARDFILANQSSNVSPAIRKFGRAVAYIVLALIVVFSLSPPSVRPEIGSVTFERWAAFALFGMLLGLGHPKAIWRGGLFVLFVVVGLEVLQQFVPNRHGRMEDALIKSTGAFMGLGLAGTIDFILSLMRRSNDQG